MNMVTSQNDPNEVYCSALSIQHEEQLYGTASQVEVFFLLEYNGSWGRKAFEESDLPEQIKDHVGKAVDEIPNSKILFIKNYDSPPEPGFRFYTAVTKDTRPLLYQYHLETYADLLALDLPEIVAGNGEARQHLSEDHLFTVCTNGRRDLCCAKFGLPVFTEMSNDGVPVWQSSHVGGHRFAANVFYFPHGILSGRLEVGKMRQLVKTFQRGQLDLNHYRGRASYPKVVQAAEYHLRCQTGELGLDAYWLQAIEELASDRWIVRFASHQDRSEHALQIAREDTGKMTRSSCIGDKQSPVIRYHLEKYIYPAGAA
jgi:hypothetical protein